MQRRSPTTPAATGTAPSARPCAAHAGWKPRQANCCPSSTSTSSSPCRRRSTRRAAQPGRGLRPAVRGRRQTLRSSPPIPKHLGAEIGFLAVLHTWGQNLLHHPHLHCVVPGGGLAADGSAGSPAAGLLPAGAGPLAGVPRQVPRALRAGLRRRRAAVPRRASRRSPTRGPSPAGSRRCASRLGRLRQAALRRPGSRCSSTWPATPTGWRSATAACSPSTSAAGHLPLEGLRATARRATRP